MVKLQPLSLTVAFAGFVTTTAGPTLKPSGSIIRLKAYLKGQVDQLRIITKPRPGYDAASHKPTIYDVFGGTCEETTHLDFMVGPIDSPAECCKKANMNGFKLWEEKQDYTVQSGDDIRVQETFLEDSPCVKRRSNSYTESTLPVGETYNSYIAQSWKSGAYFTSENIIEFHNQDIVATIWKKGTQDSTDQYFTLNGVSTYADIRGTGRGWENIPSAEWYEVNCEQRPSQQTCPCVDQGCPTEAPSSAPSSSRGDPHFTTWKQEHFEFHGQCDMILAKDSDFADGIGLDVQIRTKLVRFWSYIHTAAIRIGNDILEIQGSPDTGDREAHYWLNFDYQADTNTIGGFPLTIRSDGGHKRFFEINLDSKFPGQTIVLSTFKEFVAVDFQGGTDESFGNTVGLLGDYKTGKTLARDGATEINDFYEFGDEWQVLSGDPKLFREFTHPQFPELCIKPEDPRGDRKRRLAESTISIEQAETACAPLKDPLTIKDCVYDVLATQDMDMVGAF